MLWMYLLCCGAFALGFGATPIGARPERGIEELIPMLGSDIYRERDWATRQLLQREEAAGALQKACGAADPEVVRRARAILAAFEERRQVRLRAPLVTAARRGEIDQMIEHLARRDMDRMDWEIIFQFRARLLAFEKNAYGRVKYPDPRWPSPAFDPNQWLVHAVPLNIPVYTWQKVPFDRWKWFMVHADKIKGAKLTNPAVCSGSVDDSDICDRFLAANGSVMLRETRYSLVICDGDAKLSGASASFVIARGAIVVRGFVASSTLISATRIELNSTAQNCALVSTGPIRTHPNPNYVKDCTIHAKKANALGFVKFFETAEAGVEVAAAEGAVRVLKVHAGKRFARAGLRSGDIVLSVGGTAADSPESFRRLLRKHLAGEDDFALRVRRHGQTVEVAVACKE